MLFLMNASPLYDSLNTCIEKDEEIEQACIVSNTCMMAPVCSA